MESKKGEVRTYVIERRLRAEGATRPTWEELGEFDAAQPEDAIRAAIGEEGEPLSDCFSAVAKRNRVVLPVAQEVQTTLRIGEREFAPEKS